MLIPRMQTRQSVVTNSALAVLGLAMVALCRQGVDEIHHYVIGFGLVAMLQALLYLVAVWVVLNRPVDRWTLMIIVVSAISCRLVCLFSATLPLFRCFSLRVGWASAGRRHQSVSVHPRRSSPGFLARS